MRILLTAAIAGLLGLPALAQEGEHQVEITHLSGPVHLLKGRGGAMVASVGDDGIVLVDDDIEPMSQAVLDALASLDERPPSFVINTHWHGDHSGSNQALAGVGAVVVAHHNVRRRMSSEQFTAFTQSTTPPSPRSALPVVTFGADLSLHLNGETVNVYHVPNAHTDGDSIVHFTGSGVLHMGDAFWNGHYPRIDTDTGATVHGMMRAVGKARTLCSEGTVVVAGHGPLSDCKGLDTFREMLRATTERVKALRAQGKSLQEIQALRPNADYDETWGDWYIKPDEYLMFVYQSLAEN